MTKRLQQFGTKEIELLEKLVVLQLCALGANQSHIARFMGKSKTWVNDLLKGLPKRGSNGPGE